MDSELLVRLPFCIVLLLCFEDSIHEVSIAEKGDNQIPIVSLVHSPSQDLMENIVNDTMQEIVPGEGEKQVLAR